MFKKTLAIAAVAMFCISSFVVMAESDESAATDSTLTYSFYLELKDGSSSLSKRLPDVEVAGTEPSSALYKEALTAALTAVGYTFEYSSPTSKMLVSLNDGEHTYAKTGTFQTDGYKTFSVAHYDNGWKPSSLGESTAYVISYNEYKFTAPTGDEVGKYLENAMGAGASYWTVAPTFNPVEYRIFFDLKDGDGHSFSKWVTSTQFDISADSYSSAMIKGAEAQGFTVTVGKWGSNWGIVSITAGGFTYADVGTWGSPGHYTFGQFYADGSSWEQTNSADEGKVCSVTYGEYLFTEPPAEEVSKYSKAGDSMYGYYWIPAPSESPSGSDDSSENNNILIVGAVAIFVAVLIAVVFAAKPKSH